MERPRGEGLCWGGLSGASWEVESLTRGRGRPKKRWSGRGEGGRDRALEWRLGEEAALGKRTCDEWTETGIWEGAGIPSWGRRGEGAQEELSLGRGAGPQAESGPPWKQRRSRPQR